MYTLVAEVDVACVIPICMYGLMHCHFRFMYTVFFERSVKQLPKNFAAVRPEKIPTTLPCDF